MLYSQSDDLTDLDYETGADGEAAALVSSMHDMQPVETQGNWARFWCGQGVGWGGRWGGGQGRALCLGTACLHCEKK